MNSSSIITLSISREDIDRIERICTRMATLAGLLAVASRHRDESLARHTETAAWHLSMDADRVRELVLGAVLRGEVQP